MPTELLKKLVDNPVSYTIGAIVSVLTVIGTLLGDPTGLLFAFGDIIISQSSTLFTVTSITGFTLAPEVPQIPEKTMQQLALVFGGIFVATLLGKLGERIWETIKSEADE